MLGYILVAILFIVAGVMIIKGYTYTEVMVTLIMSMLCGIWEKLNKIEDFFGKCGR